MIPKIKMIEAHIVRLENNRIEFLLLKRSPNEKYPNIWQMVTGKIKENEKAFEAAKREIFEETGLTVNKFFVVPHLNSFYNHENDETIIIPVFVAVIDGNQIVKISNEHSEYEWVKFKKSKNLLAWPGQKKSAKIIKDFFEGKYKTLNFIEISDKLLKEN